MKKYIAEFTGTFFLVFIGTGSVVVNDQTQNSIGGLGIALCFGIIVSLMIYVFGKTSGAHFNPAVSIAFPVAGLFPVKQIIPYIISQFSGAAMASLLLHLLFPSHQTLGSTQPAGTELQSFLLEVTLTFILMMVILFFSQGSALMKKLAGVCIGLTVCAASFFAGPYCGASMNPARSFGPALVSQNFNSFWIYLLAPMCGSVLAASLWLLLKKIAATKN